MCFEALPMKKPMENRVIDQLIPPVMFQKKNFLGFIFERPAAKGMMGLTSPINLPIKILMPPNFSKNR